MGVWCPGVVSVPGISLGYCSTGLEVSVDGSEILRSPFEVGRQVIPFFSVFFSIQTVVGLQIYHQDATFAGETGKRVIRVLDEQRRRSGTR